MSKKLKNLLNSIPNGGAIEGSLRKIREEFLENIQKEVESLTPDLNPIKDKIEEIIRKFEQELIKQEEVKNKLEEKIKELFSLSNNIDKLIQKQESSIKNLLESLENKVGNRVTELNGIFIKIKEDTEEVHRICMNKVKEIKDELGNILTDVINEKNKIVCNMIERADTLKSDMNSMVKIWEQSIKQQIENFDQDFDKYFKEKGLNLIIAHIQNNALKIIWALFIGIFKKRSV